ncbi:MAG: FCD domain-containing protein [Oscillospiraceae bacterium]|nr:FCD domain-containing protein [Oscillospiraceae bacterium]
MSVSTSSLSEQAASQITDMILVEKRFQSGDKLPNEMELAQALGISRVTLREAIRILCTRGIVQIQRGRGTFVTASTSTDLSPLEHIAMSNRDLLEIRMMAEPPAAYYAAKRASKEEKQHIRELSEKIEEAITVKKANIQERLKLEQDFHNAIASASHNQFMIRLMPIINESIYNDVTHFDESITYSLQDHREIVRLIETGNAEGARAAMKMHIVHVYMILNLSID